MLHLRKLRKEVLNYLLFGLLIQASIFCTVNLMGYLENNKYKCMCVCVCVCVCVWVEDMRFTGLTLRLITLLLRSDIYFMCSMITRKCLQEILLRRFYLGIVVSLEIIQLKREMKEWLCSYEATCKKQILYFGESK